MPASAEWVLVDGTGGEYAEREVRGITVGLKTQLGANEGGKLLRERIVQPPRLGHQLCLICAKR